MKKLENNLILYHGSYCEVRLPDLEKCAKYKDFGQGFYLTTSLEQARSFSRISTKKAMANGIIDTEQQYGVVSRFMFNAKAELKMQVYPDADVEWLHCVVGHRRKKMFPDTVEELKHFDVIAGKIANDNTNATITTYMAGIFGEPGTETADNLCIGLLLPERLQNQYCFRTSKALACLTFVESERIWM